MNVECRDDNYKTPQDCPGETWRYWNEEKKFLDTDTKTIVKCVRPGI